MIYFIVLLAFYGIGSAVNKNNIKDTYPNKTSGVLFLILPMFALCAFRALSIGNDTEIYYYGFNRVHSYESLSMAIQNSRYEIGYTLLCYLVDRAGLSYYSLQIIISAFIYYSFYKFFRKYSKDCWLSCYVFLTLRFLMSTMNAVRMWIAIAVLLFSIQYLQERNLLRFLALTAIAACFHSTALIFVILYPLVKLKVNHKTISISVIISTVLFLIGRPVFIKLTELIGRYSGYLNSNYFNYESNIAVYLTLAINLSLFFLVYKNIGETSAYNESVEKKEITVSIAQIGLCSFISVYTSGVSDADYYKPLFGTLLVLAYGLYSIRLPYNSMIMSAGHFKQTQSSAIIEASLNVILSVICVQFFGLVGVTFGTLTAMFYRTCYFALYLSKNILNRNITYFIKHICIDCTAIRIQHENEQGVIHAEQYYQEHHTLDNISEDYVCADGFQLGRWLDIVRLRYRNRGLQTDIAARLKNLNMKWNSGKSILQLSSKMKSIYEDGIPRARVFSAVNHHLNVPKDYVCDDGFALGKWISKMRNKYRDGKLPPEIIVNLEEIGIIWSLQDIKWFEIFEECRAYLQDHPDAPIPRDIISTSGIKLNLWFRHNHTEYQNGLLSPERATLFAMIDFDPSERNDNKFKAKWNANYEDVVKFLQQHPEYDVSNFPPHVKGSHVQNLSVWLYNQCRAFHTEESSLTDVQRNKLRLLGADKSAVSTKGDDETWQTYCMTLKAFYDENGHTQFPADKKDLKEWFWTQRGLYKRGAYSLARLQFLICVIVFMADQLTSCCFYSRNLTVTQVYAAPLPFFVNCLTSIVILQFQKNQ